MSNVQASNEIVFVNVDIVIPSNKVGLQHSPKNSCRHCHDDNTCAPLQMITTHSRVSLAKIVVQMSSNLSLEHGAATVRPCRHSSARPARGQAGRLTHGL